MTEAGASRIGRSDRFFLCLVGWFLVHALVTILWHRTVGTDHCGEIREDSLARSFLDAFVGIQNPNATTTTTARQSSTVNNTDIDENHLPVFAICLLTRDDLALLPEWIAYHYHAVQLRHLVVAVDPDSETDPRDLLETFRKHLPELTVEPWSDADFMPDYFVAGDYGRAPNFVGGDPDHQTWREWYEAKPNFGPFKIKGLTPVNSHRYRQTRFLSRCSEHLNRTYSQDDVWMATLDTDEFLAANPWVAFRHDNDTIHNNTDDSGFAVKADDDLAHLEAGSVLRWLVRYRTARNAVLTKAGVNDDDDSTTRRRRLLEDTQDASEEAATEEPDSSDNLVPHHNWNFCLPVPRLVFGALELPADRSDPTHGLVRKGDGIELVADLPRRRNPLETIRWKFHAAPDDPRNFQQKVILDLKRLPAGDEIWGDHVHTVHRPSRSLCLEESDTNFDGRLLTNLAPWTPNPLVAFHYMGSAERYFSRPNDNRRNPKRYRERTNTTHARDASGWIDRWLERFVASVGMEAANALLATCVVEDREQRDERE